MAQILLLALILAGIGGLILSDNLIRKVMALAILNSAVVILFVWAPSQEGSAPPILLPGVRDIVDPLPQALMLTAIVVGLCLTAVALAMVMRLHDRYGTVSRRRLEELEREGHD